VGRGDEPGSGGLLLFVNFHICSAKEPIMAIPS
jgi:hypothetical protein